IESEDSKVSVGNAAKQSHDVVGVGIDCIFNHAKVSTEADLGPQPDVIHLTSLNVPNESSQISSDADMVEQNKQDALDTLIRISQHKKPKKLNVARVVSEDYKCTPEDVQLIEYIKTLPGKQVVVDIDSAWLNRNDMECLFHGDIQLSGEALSAYIHCIRDEEHLLHREGGKVFLENTFISSLLKRDGDPKMLLNYCFNMAVRMIACNDALFLLEDKYHYMDLQFCVVQSNLNQCNNEDIPLSGTKIEMESYEQESSDSSDEEWSTLSTPRKTKLQGNEKVSLTESVRSAKRCSRRAPAREHNNEHTQSEQLHGSASEQQAREQLHGSVSKQQTEVLRSNVSSGDASKCHFGPIVTQKLKEHFEKDPYPCHATKEGLAQELGLTFNQEILESLRDPEFWYVEQGIAAPDCDGSASFRVAFHRRDEKWWLSVPRVPPGGLHNKTRKQLQHKRDCANQILKAAMAINSNTLAEMEVPEPYLDSLPKNGRSTLGDIIYRYITSDQFSPECLLDCLDLSTEYQALEVANRVEASVYVWRRRVAAKPVNGLGRSNSARSSWGMVKDMMVDSKKRELLLAEQAEGLLICLKQRSITDAALAGEQFSGSIGDVDCKIAVSQTAAVPSFPVPASSTPFMTAYTTPSFSPAQLASPLKKEKTSLTPGRRSQHSRGAGTKKGLMDRVGTKIKGMMISN
ncbi:hypothetical protein ACJX0J_011018, partial [Zea mays]